MRKSNPLMDGSWLPNFTNYSIPTQNLMIIIKFLKIMEEYEILSLKMCSKIFELMSKIVLMV